MKLTRPHTLLHALFMAALIMFSCCSHEDRLTPFRWEAYTPQIDSLTIALDTGLYLGEDPDSLALILARLDSLAAPYPRLKGRLDFFRSAIFEVTEKEDEAETILRRLYNTLDSASDPYLYNRLRIRVDPDEVSISAYNRILARREFFRKRGDKFMTAAADIDLGNLLKSCRDVDGAWQAYSEADSLLRSVGFPQIALPIAINRAHALQIKGDSAEGKKILHALLKEKHIQDNLSLRYIILKNLFTSTGDTIAAGELIKIQNEEGDGVESDPGLAAYLSEKEFDNKNYAEALRLARAALNQARLDGDKDVEAVSMQRLADAFNVLGRPDSAYHYLATQVTLTDSIELAHEPDEIKATETGRLIAMRKMEHELAEGRKTLWIVSILFVIFLCIIVTAAVVAWRIHSLRLERAKASVEREKAHRRLMATLILVEEKDALLNSLSRDLRDLEQKGEISAGTKGHIVTPIKTHIVQKAGRDTFLETFSELHPDFTERLKEKAPELTDTDLRLAKYIAIGLDNKQIASTLGIRPESVKQARWRLRSKLHLQSGASLEDYLTSIVN
ncbi:MAG: LuxR C-terminal-related transcriptional regulator [Muribaculaceae bacterium]|nr:LuxR C-terminal-related transcriptional regulator [Muribaculaceae bacterium]